MSGCLVYKKDLAALSELLIHTMPVELLPTLDKLKTTLPSDVDPVWTASAWFTSFTSSLESGDIDTILSLFLDTPRCGDAYWRDLLTFTWDFRTFRGLSKIRTFLRDRLDVTRPTLFGLTPGAAVLCQPYPDVVWIQGSFSFDCEAGKGEGIFRLVPTESSEWKAWSVFTVLEEVRGFPEKIGRFREYGATNGTWAAQRAKECAFEEGEDSPSVLVVGAGQSGLGLAARLKVMGVKTLLVESTERVGDVWRERYATLSLHDPVWAQDLPYLPFPPSWPIYTPALKVAQWFESYAETMDLNVWTSTTVIKATQIAKSGKWEVTLKRGDGSHRFLLVNHLVFTAGFGVPRIPKIPGLVDFKGKMIHSSKHKTAVSHLGKKVVVVGTGSSGNAIAADHAQHGIDTTMVQRGSTYIISTDRGIRLLLGGLYGETDCPPVDVADHIGASFANIPSKALQVRKTKEISEVDKETIEGLKSVGFKVNEGGGPEGTGLLPLVWSRGGGYFIDTGACKLIIDGKIKMKSDSTIRRVTERGLVFEDGSELDADVIVFATGYGDNLQRIGDICGSDVARQCKPLWGLDEEGEVNGVWRNIGPKGLWYGTGTLSQCRYYSKRLALQIKAIEEGVFGERYSAN